MPTRSADVLICGAGVAGPTLAYWLERFGFRPTVIERTPQQRVSGGGHAVDLFGPAVEVMQWMGLLPAVERARTTTRRVVLVRPGRRPVEVPVKVLTEGVSERHVEILRGELAHILYEATRGAVEYVFGDSIQTVRDEGRRVDVTFEHGAPRTFDLVVGADGLHSATRRIVFGPEASCLRFLGGYLAVFTAPNHLHLQDRMIGLTVPGRTAAVYPVDQGRRARAVFLWRTPHPYDYDRHDPAAARDLLRGVYRDVGWEVPRLLAALDRADDLYLDGISQVLLDDWTRGRVALVGDAGYSPGPAVGGGTSLAVIGAYTLAGALVQADGDHVAGFAAYQRSLAPVVRHSRGVGPTAIKLLIPGSKAQIWVTAQAARALPHLPTGLRHRLTAFGGSAAAMLDAASLPDPEQLYPGHP